MKHAHSDQYPSPATPAAEEHTGQGLPPLPRRTRITAAPQPWSPLSPEVYAGLERIAGCLARLAEAEAQP